MAQAPALAIPPIRAAAETLFNGPADTRKLLEIRRILLIRTIEVDMEQIERIHMENVAYLERLFRKYPSR